MLVAASLAFAGCTADASAPKPPRHTAAGTAGVDDETEPKTAVRAFDADCEAALSEEEAVALLGEGAAVVTDEPTQEPADFGVQSAAFAAAGGVHCAWSSPDGRWLEVDVLPVEVVAPERVAGAAPTACVPAPTGGERCSIDLAVSESWLMVAGPSAEVVNGALAPIGSRLGDQHPEPDPEVTGAWAALPCFAAGQLVQLAAGSAGKPAPDPDATDPIRAVLSEDGRLVRCSYVELGAGIDSLSWEAVSGVSHDDLSLADLEPADVTGLDQAWTDENGTVLVVQVGEPSADAAANMLVIRGEGAQAPAAMAKLAAALIASMPLRTVA